MLREKIQYKILEKLRKVAKIVLRILRFRDTIINERWYKYMSFSERIKELRKEKGITQIELADAMGLSKGTVAMWEVGKR